MKAVSRRATDKRPEQQGHPPLTGRAGVGSLQAEAADSKGWMGSLQAEAADSKG